MFTSKIWGDPGYPPEDLVNAVGGMILLHAELSSNLFLFFHEYLTVPESCRTFIFDTLNSRARIDLITRLASEGEVAKDEEAAILRALRCFDVATENRNILAHSWLDGPEGGGFRFQRQPTPATPYGWFFAVTVADLQKQVESTRLLNLHIQYLWHALRERREDALAPLPETPPQPRKLSLFRLP